MVAVEQRVGVLKIAEIAIIDEQRAAGVMLAVEQAMQIYDLFEAVVEMELESLRALLTSIEVGKQVEVTLCVSAAEPLCALRARFPGLEWEQDEDGLQYVTRKLER